MSNISLLPQVRGFLQREHSSFIDGRQQPADNPHYLEVIDPASDQVISRVAEACVHTVDDAVASSRRGFAQWSQAAPAVRASVLLKLADLIEQHREELAQLETCQSGKLINISRNFEVDQAAHFLRYYAGWRPSSAARPSPRRCPRSAASATPPSPCASRSAW